MDEQSELPMALRTAYLAMHRRSDSEFSRFGITADQFVLLATLARGDAITQRELARRMHSDPSTVRAMLVLLEKQSFVRRETHPEDSRARIVELTHLGKSKFRQLWTAGDTIRAQMHAALNPKEHKTLVQLLQKVNVALLEEHASTPSPPELTTDLDSPPNTRFASSGPPM